MTIDAQIYSAFSTGKKMAEDKPDLLFLSFERKDKKIVCHFYKIFNQDKVPFFSLFVSDKEKLSELIFGFLLSEKKQFRFDETKDICFLNIESNVRKAFFKDWFFNRIKNVNQRDHVRVNMAIDKIK